MLRKLRLFMLVLALLSLLPATLAQGDASEATAEHEPLPEEVVEMFDYDQNAPLNVEEVSSEMRGEVAVKDITYTSPVDGRAITAYLVVPPGEGPFPGVLYVHWYEPSSPTSNRTQFVDEAVMLAEEYGVISLLPETMWSEPSWYQEGRTLDSDYDDAIKQVVELRRALHVLLAQPGVDSERVAYVGHDFGAMYGSVMAGVDQRPRAYVLIAGASNFNQWMLFGVPEDQPGLEAYMTRMDELAPTRFISHSGAPLLFQFGTEDFYTPEEDYEAFFAAAAEPKQMELYDTEHAMALPEIQEDRVAFLVEQLELE
jgi:cephalosporin-C deacetylase-like acetyl esterase